MTGLIHGLWDGHEFSFQDMGRGENLCHGLGDWIHMFHRERERERMEISKEKKYHPLFIPENLQEEA